MLADFHIHSTFSDGKHSIPEIVDYYGQRDFDAIAVTDHLCENSTFLGKAAHYLDRTLTESTLPLYLEILRSEAQRAWREYRMIVIPGFEITQNTVDNHRSAHILALGVDQYVSADGDVADIARKLRETGALVVAAHPVSTRKTEKQTYHLWNRREELAPLFDAWEVASGPHLFRDVFESGLPMLANSDLHRFSQMSSWKTVVESERHPLAVLEAIRKQRLSFYFYRDRVAGALQNLHGGQMS